MVYKWFRALSLDVAAGASVSSMAIAKSIGIDLPLTVAAILFITVWIIYTIDHLIDAGHISHTASTFRHAVHQQYPKQLIAMIGVGLAAVLFLIRSIPAVTIKYGMVLSVIIALYLLALQFFKAKIRYKKEFFIGIVYTCGIFLGPYSLADLSFYSMKAVLPFQFLILAWMNLILFSTLDKEADRKDGHISIVLDWGVKGTKTTFYLLAALLYISAIGAFVYTPSTNIAEIQGVFIAMAIGFQLIYTQPMFLLKNERYRVVGDLIFLFPGVLLI